MSSPLATLSTSVFGEWDLHVQEPESLPRLRRQALREACACETDGSPESWVRLPPPQRAAADLVLANLVSLHRDRLETEAPRETFATGWRPNLLPDSGLDWVCANASRMDFFYAAYLGIGTTATVYDPGSTTATASGTACSASSPFFTAGMVGMLIHWDTGEEAYIASVTDATHAVLVASTTASGAFAVHAVNRTGLASPSVSQTAKTNDSLTRASGTTTRTLSWVFALETTNKIYTEGGIQATNGGAFLSVFLLTGGSVTVLIGQQAKLYYAFSASVPTTAQSATWPAASYDASAPGGWDSASGQHQVLSVCAADGLASETGAGLLPTGDGTIRACLSTASSLLGYTDDQPAVETGMIGSYVNGSISTYIPGTFYRDKSFYFSATHSDTTAIRSVLFRGYYTRVYWQFLFDSAKTKDGNHALTLPIRCALRRVLTNP